MRVRLIRLPPGSQHRVGDEVESDFAWWLVDFGYAVPIDFERPVDPVRAAHLRRRYEQTVQNGKDPLHESRRTPRIKQTLGDS
jgi:hypothetical protein